VLFSEIIFILSRKIQLIFLVILPFLIKRYVLSGKGFKKEIETGTVKFLESKRQKSLEVSQYIYTNKKEKKSVKIDKE
jgi:hypothetical protein